MFQTEHSEPNIPNRCSRQSCVHISLNYLVFKDATGVWPSTEEWEFDNVGTLEEAVKSCSNPTDFIEREDIMAFSNLLEGLLCPDAMRRITPGQALRHDFITMCHMTDNMDTSSYVQAAYELMNVSPPYDLDEYENTLSSEQDVFSRDEDKDLKQEEIISNKSTQYLVLDFIGEGCFGKVAKCLNLKTDKTTAIKIFKDIKEHKEEVKMLEQLRALDPEKNNLLEYIDSFIIQDVPYVTFEMLDTSLWDFVLQRRAPLTPKEIRPIARQLLVAFEALKSIGLIHTDLKPDNVMFVNHKDEPFKVKLIDFGLAMPASEVKTGMIMQPCGYRAPEVNLGLPICEAIDMWGLGCTLAFLFFGQGIFSGKSTYNSVKTLRRLKHNP
uniref:Protein kinase domain-containing protein n=1 Tax=Cyclopterus lumpus TaxID=8103 RepID=A0A8C3AJU2_CYCLU